MATFYSNVAAKQTETNAGKLLPVDFGGRVRVIHGLYKTTGTEKSGDKLVLCRLPKGARVLPLTAAVGSVSGLGTLTIPAEVTAEETDLTLEVTGTVSAGQNYVFNIYYVVD